MGFTTESADIKSSGNVIGSVTVQKFDDVPSAVEFFHKTDDEGNVNVDGGAAVLELINSQHRSNCMNQERARLTRSQSPIAALRSKIKTDPEAKAEVAALMNKLGINPEDL